MPDSREYMDTNRAHWDELAAIHPGTAFYGLESFKAGRSTLDRIEREQVGDVRGKSLLHLQCHFGMDTISWARLGARATGADFSARAIETATALARDLNVDVTFVESNIYDLPNVLDEQFDIVFTSHGVLGWLPDIRAWGQVVAHFVKPGGRFVIVEGHPFPWVFDDEVDEALVVKYPYFTTTEPLTFETDGSYADRDAPVTNKTTHNWNHPLGDIIRALIEAGLTVEHVGEYPFCAWQMLPFMIQDPEGFWRLPEGYPLLPLMFSIRARK